MLWDDRNWDRLRTFWNFCDTTIIDSVYNEITLMHCSKGKLYIIVPSRQSPRPVPTDLIGITRLTTAIDDVPRIQDEYRLSACVQCLTWLCMNNLDAESEICSYNLVNDKLFDIMLLLWFLCHWSIGNYVTHGVGSMGLHSSGMTFHAPPRCYEVIENDNKFFL